MVVAAPPLGFHHAASLADVRAALQVLGVSAWYGLRQIRLVSQPVSQHTPTLRFGRYAPAGMIDLYPQPPSPWRVHGTLAPAERDWLSAWGATAEQLPSGLHTLVHWPAGALRRYVLLEVLPHEVGHHVLQHERRKTRVRVARTADHEAFADGFAHLHRPALAAALRLELPSR
jgi:hypothetical protein